MNRWIAVTKTLAKKTLGQRVLGSIDYLRFPMYKNTFGGPFNGQICRQQMFRELMQKMPFVAIVETGTYRGDTTGFLYEVSKLPVYTVEAHPRHYGYAKARFLMKSRVHCFHGDSREFLRKLAGKALFNDAMVFVYLDAHWNTDLPLREEIQIVFANWENAVAMVDDFQVGGDEGYGYDDYGRDRTLCLDFLESLGYLGLAKYFPAMSSEFETGAKRGCVVLACSEIIITRLNNLQTLLNCDSKELRLSG